MDLEKILDALISATPYVQDAAYDEERTELGRQKAQAIADEIGNLVRSIEAEIKE